MADDTSPLPPEMRPESWSWRAGLEPRTSADAAAPADRVLAKLEGAGRVQTILQLLANNPRVFRPFVLIGDALVVQTALAPAERETLVLWLAGRKGLAYEAETHRAGARRAGLSDAQVGALLAGGPPPHDLTDRQQLVIQFAEQTTGPGRLTDEVWERAVAAWGTDGALDLLVSVGYWGGLVPMLIKGLELVPRS